MNWSAEYCVKALEIYEEFGCKNGEAAVYLNLGSVLNLSSLKSSVLLEALAIIKEIGNNKEGEAAAAYANLGSVSTSDGEYSEAEEYHKKALEINKETGNIACAQTKLNSESLVIVCTQATGNIEREFQTHLFLTYCSVRSERRLYTTVPNLLESIQNSEEMYSLLGSNSVINVSRYPFLRSTLLLPTGCSVTCRLCFWEYV